MSETQPPEQDPNRPMSGRQAYNLVSDTVTGANIRFKDNLYQGLFILACIILGALIGTLARASAFWWVCSGAAHF